MIVVGVVNVNGKNNENSQNIYYDYNLKFLYCKSGFKLPKLNVKDLIKI